MTVEELTHAWQQARRAEAGAKAMLDQFRAHARRTEAEMQDKLEACEREEYEARAALGRALDLGPDVIQAERKPIP